MLPLLVLVLAAADGGAPPADGGGGVTAIDYGCPEAPPAVQVDGGWFYPELRASRQACLLAATAKHRDILLEKQEPAPIKGEAGSGMAIGIAVLVLVAAFAGGVLVDEKIHGRL